MKVDSSLVLTALVVHWTCKIPLHPKRLAAVIGFTGLASVIVVICTQWPLLRIPLLIVGVSLGLQTTMLATVWAGAKRRLPFLQRS